MEQQKNKTNTNKKNFSKWMISILFILILIMSYGYYEKKQKYDRLVKKYDKIDGEINKLTLHIVEATDKGISPEVLRKLLTEFLQNKEALKRDGIWGDLSYYSDLEFSYSQKIGEINESIISGKDGKIAKLEKKIKTTEASLAKEKTKSKNLKNKLTAKENEIKASKIKEKEYGEKEKRIKAKLDSLESAGTVSNLDYKQMYELSKARSAELRKTITRLVDEKNLLAKEIKDIRTSLAESNKKVANSQKIIFALKEELRKEKEKEEEPIVDGDGTIPGKPSSSQVISNLRYYNIEENGNKIELEGGNHSEINIKKIRATFDYHPNQPEIEELKVVIINKENNKKIMCIKPTFRGNNHWVANFDFVLSIPDPKVICGMEGRGLEPGEYEIKLMLNDKVLSNTLKVFNVINDEYTPKVSSIYATYRKNNRDIALTGDDDEVDKHKGKDIGSINIEVNLSNLSNSHRIIIQCHLYDSEDNLIDKVPLVNTGINGDKFKGIGRKPNLRI